MSLLQRCWHDSCTIRGLQELQELTVRKLWARILEWPTCSACGAAAAVKTILMPILIGDAMYFMPMEVPGPFPCEHK